tara:strand:+ start:501 stop:713 length:213 start_codon:yes stop_codon:yes gene_type:complete
VAVEAKVVLLMVLVERVVLLVDRLVVMVTMGIILHNPIQPLLFLELVIILVLGVVEHLAVLIKEVRVDLV